MSTVSSGSTFSLLLDDQPRQDEFEPFYIKAAPPVFEELSSASMTLDTPPKAESDTYQRIPIAPHAPLNSLQDLLLNKNNEIEELKQRLTRAEAEVTQLNVAHDSAISQSIAENHTALATQISAGLNAIEEQLLVVLQADIAAVLKPFVTVEVHNNILAEFTKSLSQILHQEPAVQIIISGPVSLLDELKSKLNITEANLRFAPQEKFELTAQINSQILSTRFERWASLLATGATQ